MQCRVNYKHGCRSHITHAGSHVWSSKAYNVARVLPSRRPLSLHQPLNLNHSHTLKVKSAAEDEHLASKAPKDRAAASSTATTNSSSRQQAQQGQPAVSSDTPARRASSRELDVNRAVRLLKLTTQRSSRNTSKLPPWFTRTQDPDVWDGSEQSLPYSAEEYAASIIGTTNSRVSKQPSFQDAADVDDASPIDSYMALAEPTVNQHNTQHQNGSSTCTSSQSSTNSTSSSDATRVRSRSPLAGSATAANSNYSSRMYSASDPIRSSSPRRGNTGPLPWFWQGVDNTDAAKEQERQFRRAVFSFDRWAAHRSTARYLRHFRGIFSSRTFQGLLQPMSFFAGMAVACGLYNVYAVPAGAPIITISSTPLDITAFAVSLLLVFRTDSSYARWEEALKTWNEVRSHSKDLARQSCYWVNEPARKAMLVRWCEAFSRALLVHCRVDGNLEHELEDVLLPHEVAAVAAVGPSGAPSFVLQVLAELIEQCGVTETKEDTMFDAVRTLSDSVAVCNKLLRYPLPLAYTRHTSRFMFLWLSAMPWAMWADMHWVCVPITAAISYLLLGIDEIGVQIEEPFGILPLEDVCVDITAEIDAMMERQDIVTDLLAAGGVDCAPRSTCGECGQPVAAQAPHITTSSSSSSSRPGSPGGSSSGSHVRSASVIVPEAPDSSYEGSLWHEGTAAAAAAESSEIPVQPEGPTAEHQVVRHAEARLLPAAAADSTSSSVGGSPDAVGPSHGNSSAAAAAAAAPFVEAGVCVSTADVSRRQYSLANSSSSSSSSRSRSSSPAVAGISRTDRPSSSQGLIAKWVTSTSSGSADTLLDPLSSLEDAVAPGFDVRGLSLNDLKAVGVKEEYKKVLSSSQQQQQQERGDAWVNSSGSYDEGFGSSSSRSGKYGKYQRQPTPDDDHRYPD